MGNFKFAMTLLVKEYKKSAFYALTMVFSIAVCFIFFNIMNNDLLADPGAVVGGATWNQVNVPLSTTLSFIIICFCCFMIFFANSFFISRKTNEIAIMTLSGNSSFKSTKFDLSDICIITDCSTNWSCVGDGSYTNLKLLDVSLFGD